MATEAAWLKLVEQSPDHRNGELQHFRAGAEGQGQGEHAKDGGLISLGR